MKMKIIFLLISFFSFKQTFCQNELSLEKIMHGYDFIGYPPKDIMWSWDNKRIYFKWNPERELIYSTYYYDIEKKEIKKNPVNESYQLLLTDEKQNSFKHIFYIDEGSLFLYDKKSKTKKCLIQTLIPISNIFISNNENIIVYEQNKNLFELNITDNTTKQITNFIKGNKSTEKVIENIFLEQQQEELFSYIKKNNQINNQLDIFKTSKLKHPKEIFYGLSDLEQIQINNKRTFVSFVLSDYPENKETEYIEMINKSGYSKTKKSREKVSIYNVSKHKLCLYNILKDSTYFINLENLPHLNDVPAYYSLYTNLSDKKLVKEFAIHPLIFSENEETALLDVRSQDNKHRWILLIYLIDGRYDVLEYQFDPAWIGGPGISEWNFVPGVLGFDKNEKNVYFQSEESGFSHLYVFNLAERKKSALTNGKWEVRDAVYSRDENSFYLHINKSNLGNIDFYRYDLESKKLTCILEKEGGHQALVSPNRKYIAYLFSNKITPWELYLKSNQNKTDDIKLTDSQSKEFKNLTKTNPTIIYIKGKDGENTPARIYEPLSKNKKSAVMFVHGAGYLQNAHNYWSTYYREFLFHQLLAREGICVIDIDYKASDGYGRDYRTAIYRNMGGKDLDDYIEGRNYLIRNYNIDSNKIAIYGGSYGGFLTIMALLKYPGKFACGAALRSVTDWSHYNLEYTSNILNFPETDPESFRISSPIYYTENLKDELLILHGLVDDNVHYQDVIRFSQLLIEKGKKNWNMTVYPIENHGFTEYSSWLDEYNRIYQLFIKYLY